MRRWRLLAVVGLAAAGIAAVAITDYQDIAMREPAPLGHPSRLAGVRGRVPPSDVRWIAVGGGIDPSSNQVSLEQDLALAARVLGDDGVTLFAGGPGLSPVQVLAARDESHSLHEHLGSLFLPRDGRHARYREARLHSDGDARAGTVIAELAESISAASSAPLFLLVATHGEPGEQPNANLIRLWGGTPINVTDLAQTLDELPSARPLRLLMASCFSGGFADIVFTGAEPERGPSPADRCGLFATTWDAEAAGCDPNPDRRAQESYFIHVLHALQGQSKTGDPLPALDRDGDGNISLLEAHTQARIASLTISVPTTTSERWLRHVGPADGPEEPFTLVEESAAVNALGAALGIADAAAAREKLAALEKQADATDEGLEVLEQTLDIASADLRIALLERWPVLDDPYHPEYRAILDANAARIRDVLERSSEAEDYRAASMAVHQKDGALAALEVDIAMLKRLIRAHENLKLAARLHAKGGAAWKHYLRLLTCERTLPPR